VAAFIVESSRSSKGQRLIAADIKHYMKCNFGVQYQQSNIYRPLHELQFSWITSRSKPLSSQNKSKKSLKKFQIETINLIPGILPWTRSIFGFRMKHALVNKIRRPTYGQRKAAGHEWLTSNSLSTRSVCPLFVWHGVSAHRGD